MSNKYRKSKENKIYTHRSAIEKSHRWYSDIFKECKNGKKITVLDLGSANARFYKMHHKYVSVYHAFDFNKEAVDAGRYFLEHNGKCDWDIRVCDLSNCNILFDENKDVLLEEYDMVIYNKVFHHIYRGRQYQKWNRGKYKDRDLLYNTLKMANKWYVFSTTCKHMKLFNIKEIFLSNNFKIKIEDKRKCVSSKPLNPWHCLFERV